MLLSVRGLSVEYASGRETSRPVNDVSFDIPSGTIVGLVGESGCGKSTVALGLLGLVRGNGRITSGRVDFEGTDLLALSGAESRKYRGARIGLITQHPRRALNPLKRVGEQIKEYYQSHVPATDDEAHERSLELLVQVGLNDPQRRMRAFPHELSGGMAQRVLIAMAISCRPQLLIADEPTTALDATIQAEILDLLRALCRERQFAMLLVTHDMSVVANYCDHLYLMNAGEVVESAPVDRMFKDPAHPAAIALMALHDDRYDREIVRLRDAAGGATARPGGCHLHPRCPFADEAAGCYTVHPGLSCVSDDHFVRCHRAGYVSGLGLREAATE